MGRGGGLVCTVGLGLTSRSKAGKDCFISRTATATATASALVVASGLASGLGEPASTKSACEINEVQPKFMFSLTRTQLNFSHLTLLSGGRGFKANTRKILT